MNQNQINYLIKEFEDHLNSERMSTEVMGNFFTFDVMGNFFIFNDEKIPLKSAYIDILLPYSLLITPNMSEFVDLLNKAKEKIKKEFNIKENQWVGRFYVSEVRNSMFSADKFITLAFSGASLSKILHSQKFKETFDELINE